MAAADEAVELLMKQEGLPQLAIPPAVWIMLVQAILKIMLTCWPQPANSTVGATEAHRYLTRPMFRFRARMRENRIRWAVERSWLGDPAHLPAAQDAVLSAIKSDKFTPQLVANLYAESV